MKILMSKPLTGYDGVSYKVGDKVQLRPAEGSELFGRFATVVGTSLTINDRVHVEFEGVDGVFCGKDSDFRLIEEASK